MSIRHRGMTFLELTIVVLVVGLLAAIATPHFASALQKRNTRNAALEIAGLMRYARDVALNEGRTVTITIDSEQDTFRCPSIDFPDIPGTPIEISVKERFDSSIELSASFNSQNQMSYNLEGIPTVGPTLLPTGLIRVSSLSAIYDIQLGASQSGITITEIGTNDGIGVYDSSSTLPIGG